jgi:hypothetical protein
VVLVQDLVLSLRIRWWVFVHGCNAVDAVELIGHLRGRHGEKMVLRIWQRRVGGERWGGRQDLSLELAAATLMKEGWGQAVRPPTYDEKTLC